MKNVIEFQTVTKNYPGEPPVQAINRVSFELSKGAFASLVGPSGSGKTTLLNLAAGLDTPSEGRVLIAGHDTSKLSFRELCIFRRQHLGFVFQAYNLFPVLSALENVEYTCLIRGDDKVKARARAMQSLQDVGLSDHAHRRPSQLSGGQQQRVAVARAIASDPEVIFADEPTANLDSKTALQLIELFQRLNETHRMTFLFSTHDHRIIESVKTVIEIKDGKIENQKD